MIGRPRSEDHINQPNSSPCLVTIALQTKNTTLFNINLNNIIEGVTPPILT